MACYNPIKAYRGQINPETGNEQISWKRPGDRKEINPYYLPCGKCLGCRKHQSQQWAIRCVHEAKMHKENCFVTLTYSQDKLPQDGSLDRLEFKRFLKNVKREYPEKKIRYYHCGEYGDKLKRPHYHALLFGVDFDDKRLWSTRKIRSETKRYYVSEKCSKAWGKGQIIITDVNYETAGYVARYCMKKLGLGKKGVIDGRIPEYATMSRVPGIGHSWYQIYQKDVYPSDSIHTLQGHILRPPRYYDEKLRKENPSLYAQIKAKRKKEGNKLTPYTKNGKVWLLNENDLTRLAVKEFLATEKFGKKDSRPMEVST